MQRLVTDDLYHPDDDPCLRDDDVYDDDDEWVLSEVLKRRGAEVKHAEYLCTWAGYDDPTWETRGRLIALGYLSRLAPLDAALEQSLKKAAAASRARPQAVSKSRLTMAEKYAALRKESVYFERIGTVGELYGPDISLPQYPCRSREGDDDEEEEEGGNRPDRAVVDIQARWDVNWTKWPSAPVYSMAPHGDVNATFAALFSRYISDISRSSLTTQSRRNLRAIVQVLKANPLDRGSLRQHMARAFPDFYPSSLDPNTAVGSEMPPLMTGSYYRGIPPLDLLLRWFEGIHGEAELWYPDGSRYRGETYAGQRHGRGQHIHRCGRGFLSGQWAHGFPSNNCRLMLPGVLFDGNFAGSVHDVKRARFHGAVSIPRLAENVDTGACSFYGEFIGIDRETFAPITLLGRYFQFTVGDAGLSKYVSLLKELPVTQLVEVLSTRPTVDQLKEWLVRDGYATSAELETADYVQATAAAMHEKRRREADARRAAIDGRTVRRVATFPNGTYRGKVKLVTGARHGQGCYQWTTGQTYDGAWLDDKMHGEGVYTWPDGRRYTGAFEADVMCGRGCYTFGDGTRYEGTFANDLIRGAGTYHHEDGTTVAVEWEDVHPLDAVFLANPAFGAPVDAAVVETHRRERTANRGDPRTAALAVPSHLPPASLLTDPGVEAACVVCRDETKTRAVVPCGHLCVCDECAETGKLTQCPLCRVDVEMLLKLYV